MSALIGTFDRINGQWIARPHPFQMRTMVAENVCGTDSVRVVNPLDDLIAAQEQSRRHTPLCAPLHAPVAIDWKPFIAAFHRLAPKTWRAYTNVLGGDLLLRLAGKEMTLEQRIHQSGSTIRTERSESPHINSHYWFAFIRQISDSVIDDCIDYCMECMLAEFKSAEQRGVEAMKAKNGKPEKAQHTTGAADAATENPYFESPMAAAMAKAKSFEEPDRELPANNFWCNRSVKPEVSTPRPSPTSLKPVFRMGDEVEWNVVGPRIDHGIIEAIDEVAAIASRIRVADGYYDWHPLSALRHRAKPAEMKFKKGDRVSWPGGTICTGNVHGVVIGFLGSGAVELMADDYSAWVRRPEELTLEPSLIAVGDGGDKMRVQWGCNPDPYPRGHGL